MILLVHVQEGLENDKVEQDRWQYGAEYGMEQVIERTLSQLGMCPTTSFRTSTHCQCRAIRMCCTPDAGREEYPIR
jgi:hypothetical protein